MSDKYLNELVQTLAAFSDHKQLRKFLVAILTPKELDELPKRLQIIKMLKKGVAQRDISAKLKVGVATITRGSKELHKGNFKDIQ